MAWMLSEIRLTLLLAAIVGAQVSLAPVWAQESQPVIVQNPFADRASRSALQENTSPRRQPTGAYRNPFTPGATAVPVRYTLLQGPVSRWKSASPMLDGPSLVKSAILSAASMDGNHLVESVTAPPALDLNVPPDPASFSSTSPNQPAWLLPEAQPLRMPSPIAPASFHQPARLADDSPIVITDMGDAQACLEQAQQAATAAQSLDDFLALAGLCQRGLAEKPTIELATSLRQLAAWAHNRRGELLADADQPQEAFDAFRFAISLDANCSQAIHNRAVWLAQHHQFAAALRDFNRVIELNPGLAVAYRNRGELLAASGRINEAVADYTRAIEMLPEDAELYSARGYAWQQIGEFDHAETDYDRALQIAPGDPITITQRGNLAAQRGDYDSALADYRQAIAVDPEGAGAYRSLAWLRATAYDARQRDTKQALSAARLAMELSAPNDYLALEAMAAALAADGQFAEAVRLQQQAVGVAPPAGLEPMRHRLELYKAQQPFVSDPADNAVRADVATSPISRPSPRPRSQ